MGIRLRSASLLLGLLLPLAALAQAPDWSVPVHAPGPTSANLGNGQYVTRAMAADAAGNVFVTGSYAVGTDVNFVTTKITAAGAVAWQKTFAGAAAKADAAAAVAVDAAGNAIVTGPSVNAAGTGDVVTIKYAPDGTVLWQKTYDGGRDDASYGVVVDAAQNVIIAAETIGTPGNADIRVLKYSGADGTLLWQRGFDSGREDYVNDIALDAAGDIIVLGVSINAAGNTDIRLLKVSGASGTIAWNQVYDSGADDQAFGLAVDAGGNAVVVGYSVAPARAVGIVLKHAGSDGRQLWRKTLDAGYGDYGQALALDAAGNIAAGLQSVNAYGNFDFRTVKLAGSDGTLLWDRRFDSGGEDYLYHLAVDAGGNVAIAGSMVVGNGNTDWRVMRYAGADGTVLLRYNYAGAAGTVDDAFAVAANAAGVFIAGTSRESGSLQAVRVTRFPAMTASPPAVPKQVSPTGTITASLNPTYVWNASAGATSYWLTLRNASGGVWTDRAVLATDAGCASGTGTCSFRPGAALPNNTSWTWVVNATNANGTSAWSTGLPISMAVPSLVPPVPTQVGPTGPITNTFNPTFVWNASAGATSYWLTLRNAGGVWTDRSVTAVEAGCAAGTGTCSFTPGAGPPNNTFWTWVVKATNAHGSSAFSAGLPISISVAAVAPPAPTLVSPAGTIATTLPTYTWNASPGAISYTLFVQNLYGIALNLPITAKQAGCPSGTGACSYTPALALGNNAKWSWFVNATNDYGTSAWSVAGRITVSAP